jgi:hypothetical protein
MVGCCGDYSATFTAGKGTVTYYNVGTAGTDGIITGESSNMGYGGPNYVSTNVYDQSFTG